MVPLFDNERMARCFGLHVGPALADTARQLLHSLDLCLDRCLPAPVSLRLDREGAALLRKDGRLRVEPDPALRAGFAELASLDLFRLFIPVGDGGLGLPVGLYYLAVQQIALHDAALALTALVQGNVVYALSRHGRPEQKQRYLPRLAAGELLGTIAYTEPQAGSDAGAIRTRALPEAGGFRLSGSKCWITHGGDADLLLTSARTGPPELGIRGVSTFLLEREADGVEVLGLEDKTGLAGSPTAALDYPDLRLPADRLVGQLGGGGAVMFSGIGITRVGIGAQALGVGKRAFAAAVEFARQRVQGGRPIIEHAAIQQRLAEMAASLSAMENLICRAALLESQGQWHVREIAVTKYYCAEALQRLTTLAIAVHGGYGCSRDYPVERCRREAVALALFGGTSEIQWSIITRELLEAVAGQAHTDYQGRDRATLAELDAGVAHHTPLLPRLRAGQQRLWELSARLAAVEDPAPFAAALAEAATALEVAAVLLRQASASWAGELETELAGRALRWLEGRLQQATEQLDSPPLEAALRSGLIHALG